MVAFHHRDGSIVLCAAASDVSAKQNIDSLSCASSKADLNQKCKQNGFGFCLLHFAQHWIGRQPQRRDHSQWFGYVLVDLNGFVMNARFSLQKKAIRKLKLPHSNGWSTWFWMAKSFHPTCWCLSFGTCSLRMIIKSKSCFSFFGKSFLKLDQTGSFCMKWFWFAMLTVRTCNIQMNLSEGLR